MSSIFRIVKKTKDLVAGHTAEISESIFFGINITCGCNS
jgi:hypothetical protein